MPSSVKPFLSGRALVPHYGVSFIHSKVLASPVASDSGSLSAAAFSSPVGSTGPLFGLGVDAILWPLEIN